MTVAFDQKPYLTPGEAGQIAGMTSQRVRLLIEAGKLPAVNVSTTENRPRWSIRRVDLERFLTPIAVQKTQAKQQAAARRTRIDAHVPHVFG